MNQPQLIGHEKRWAALARAFERGIVPQSLLISGAPGVGKWTLARRYAQLLLCPHALEADNRDAQSLPAPCEQCRVCHQVEIETFPDFKVYRPFTTAAKDRQVAPEALESSKIFIEDARGFGHEAMHKPLVGPRKVMMLVQADRMTEDAQNTLLKTFEEPVPGLCIMLLSDKPQQLRATVRSRCWNLLLGLSSDAAIASWLGAHFEASRAQIEEAVRVANGRPGIAWRELERLHQLAARGEAALSRFAQADGFIQRIERALPVAALALTEEALRLSAAWGVEDQTGDLALGAQDEKKMQRIMTRSNTARFLEELSKAYRARWMQEVEARQGAETAPPYACGLDLIHKTRHYILGNANASLALDVLFGRLIALHHAGR